MKAFPVFSSGQLWQNLSPRDLGARIVTGLGVSGVTAGIGSNSRAFVEGKANAMGHFLLDWNPALVVGSTPWCAEGAHLIFVDGDDLFQYRYGELDSSGPRSRTVSDNFDFSRLVELRDRYLTKFFNGAKDSTQDLALLSSLLDETFEENGLSLDAAGRYQREVSPGIRSADYPPPRLTKYERLTHDSLDRPMSEVSFALAHYEKAIREFNGLKTHVASGRRDEAFLSGIYCVVAVAASLEAIGNYLVHSATGHHPGPADRRQPIEKINMAAAQIATVSHRGYASIGRGDQLYEVLDRVRQLRNRFMHAKESADDIDASVQSSVLSALIDEGSCRLYLGSLRGWIHDVFEQIPEVSRPIVTDSRHVWMGELEVP
ncbi:hypothetical protein [Stenotrophomonas sp. SrG]|uniref:hypothetical protein n=1 Tax=Stenotrophomonas sp. SrG TaxID=3414430 RepID=UPI003CF730FC